MLIDVPSLGQRLVFPCGRWLDKGKDDGQLERELMPGVDTEETYTPCKQSCTLSYCNLIKGAPSGGTVLCPGAGCIKVGRTTELYVGRSSLRLA